MRTKRNPIRVVLYAAALLVACSFGSRANAQSQIQGKFTLPYAVQWGKASLPPGDYVFTFTQGLSPNLLSIRDAKSLRGVAYEPTSIRQDDKGESALLISVRGKRHVVRSLSIAELGEAFVFPSAQRRERATEEARHAQTIPVLVAKN
jgi:hypothetical protein